MDLDDRDLGGCDAGREPAAESKCQISELVKGVTSMELTIVDESDTGADIGGYPGKDVCALHFQTARD